MAYIPDEAVVRQYAELSPAAATLYNYYCMKRNRKTGSWNCPSSTVLSALPGFAESTYFRSRKELLDKNWIRVEGNCVTPLVGFPPLKDGRGDPSSTLKNESQKKERALKIESSTLKNESRTLKIESSTLKNESDIYRNIPALLPNNITNNITNNGGVAACCPEGPDSVTPPGTSEEHSEETDPVPVTGKFSAEIREVFEYWRERTGHPKATLTKTRITRIRARLNEKFTVDDLKRSVDGCMASPWHQGKNPGGTVYTGVDTIFRDADQVEKLGKLAPNNNGNGNGHGPAEYHNPHTGGRIGEFIR